MEEGRGGLWCRKDSHVVRSHAVHACCPSMPMLVLTFSILYTLMGANPRAIHMRLLELTAFQVSRNGLYTYTLAWSAQVGTKHRKWSVVLLLTAIPQMLAWSPQQKESSTNVGVMMENASCARSKLICRKPCSASRQCTWDFCFLALGI